MTLLATETDKLTQGQDLTIPVPHVVLILMDHKAHKCPNSQIPGNAV